MNLKIYISVCFSNVLYCIFRIDCTIFWSVHTIIHCKRVGSLVPVIYRYSGSARRAARTGSYASGRELYEGRLDSTHPGADKVKGGHHTPDAIQSPDKAGWGKGRIRNVGQITFDLNSVGWRSLSRCRSWLQKCHCS